MNNNKKKNENLAKLKEELSEVKDKPKEKEII